jgi:two-component system phosphate regulon sensor histidine kinase PhoR
MDWLIKRVLTCLAAGIVGGLLGALAGAMLGVPGVLAGLGAAAAIGAIVAVDTLRGARLIRWLRGGHETAAPRDTGFWGELGYRAERSIRSRERDAQQERLRLEQFLAAIEASPNGVMLLDAGQHIEWCNAVAADHFGIDPARDRRQRVTNLVRSPAFVAALQSGSPDAAEVPDPSGRGLLSVLFRPYGDGALLVISQDVTEREKNEGMRRDFVANVSHEIRTPLTVLSGFIDTMSSLPLSEVERRRVMALMSQQAQRMQTIVSDLLVLAQLEGSPRPAADRWFAVRPLFDHIESDALALSAGRHRLSFTCDEGLLFAGADKELHSAISNLVTNAIRYTPEGGSIEVRGRRMADGSAEVVVVDTGIGIAREHLPRLTERFYRVDGSRSRDTGGTGLGLSIVKHVVQRHAGELEIDSEPGRGSTFRIVLPAARVRRSAEGARQSVDEEVSR